MSQTVVSEAQAIRHDRIVSTNTVYILPYVNEWQGMGTLNLPLLIVSL